jgi:hypothetical protein
LGAIDSHGTLWRNDIQFVDEEMGTQILCGLARNCKTTKNISVR